MKYLRGGEKKEVFFFYFSTGLKEQAFRPSAESVVFGGDFGECRFSHFSRTKMSQKFETENDG